MRYFYCVVLSDESLIQSKIIFTKKWKFYGCEGSPVSLICHYPEQGIYSPYEVKRCECFCYSCQYEYSVVVA